MASTVTELLRRRFGGKKGILPEGYTQKDMLVSHGAYVSLQLDLQYFTFATSLMWGTVGRNSLIGNSQSYFGINTSSGWRTNDTPQSQSYTNMGVANTTDIYNVTYKREVGLTSLVVNGEEGSVATSARSATTLYLFNMQNNSTYRCYAKLGETFIYDQDNVLVSHLIPCIDSDNQSGMYDVVRNMFFTHANFTTI